MKKILKDRLNHLKSEYAFIYQPKLTKVGIDEQKLILHSKIEEIEWLINKYNKINEKKNSN